MITETKEYKGLKFECNSCGYVVSSNATSDFDVEDFSFCPYCGFNHNKDGLNNPQLTLRVIACEVMKHQDNYSEDTNHMFSKGVQAYVVALENKIRELEIEK